MNSKGLFIVFEGIDGSGESTQAALLKDFLEKMGKKVLLTKEPYIENESGKKIREVLEKKVSMDLKELQILFTENRREHLEKLIEPALNDGVTVISDRYYFSTFAFGAASGVDLEYLISLNEKFLHPNVTFILDVAPEISMERIDKRGKPKEFFEKVDRLKNTREYYKLFPKRFKDVYLIDGERSIEEVFEEIKRRINL